MKESTIPVMEPCVITDAFATGFLGLEIVAPGVVRATAYVVQTCHSNGEKEHHVVEKIVAPYEAWRELALRILNFVPAGKLSFETEQSIAARCGTRLPQ